MPQSHSYWRRVDFVRSDTLIRSAIARWRLAGVEWLRAIFAVFLAPVPAGRCRERPGSSPAVAPPRRPSFVLLFTSHGTSVQLLKSTPALRPVFLVPARARIATHFCAHATAYPANPEWSSRSFSWLSAARQGVSGPRVVQPFLFTRYPRPGRRFRIPGGPAVHLQSLSAARKASPGSRVVQPSISLAIRRQEGVSGPRVVQAFIFTCYTPPGRCFRTATGPEVYRHSLSAARKAYRDPEWSSRSSSLAIRRQEGVYGPRVVQAFVRTRYPPPERRIGTPSGPAVHFHSLSATGDAFPDRDWSYRSSSLAIRRQEGAPRPRVVQPFIFSRYRPPGERIRTPSGPGVRPHSLSASRKAYRDPEWSSRSFSLAVRHRGRVSRPRLVLPFIFTRYPPPGRRTQTPSGSAVHLQSLSATRRAYPDPKWSRRSSALAIRLQKGVSGTRVVQSFIFTRCPLPGRRIRTLDGPAVHLHSLSASRKAYPDPEWSSRSSSLALRCQEGVSGPWMVQPFIFTRCPLPGRPIQTRSGPGVYPHSLSAARKASPVPEWSSCSSSLAIRRQEGVPGPWMVQPFIFTRCPPPGRRIQTSSGPGVHPHSLSASRKAYREPEWSSHSSSLALRCQEGVSGPRVVQPFIFTRYPLPGRRIWTPSGRAVHSHSLSAARKAYPDPEWSRRSFSLAIRCQEGVSGARVVQAFIFTRYRLLGRRLRTPSGPGVHLHSLSAARKAYPDPEWSRRSSALAIRLQKGVSGPPVVQQFIFTRTPLPGRRIETPDDPAVHLHSLSATGKAYADRDWSYRSYSLAVRRQECAPRPRVVQPFIFTRYPLPGRRIRSPSGPGVYLHSLSAARKASPDPEWSRRSSSLAIRCQEGVSGPRVVQAFIRTRYPPPERRIGTPSGPAVHLHSHSAARKAYRDTG